MAPKGQWTRWGWGRAPAFGCLPKTSPAAPKREEGGEWRHASPGAGAQARAEGHLAGGSLEPLSVEQTLRGGGHWLLKPAHVCLWLGGGRKTRGVVWQKIEYMATFGSFLPFPPFLFTRSNFFCQLLANFRPI